MITADFYNALANIPCGDTENLYNNVRTDGINNLYAAYGDDLSADAYFLGWIKSENLPFFLGQSTIKYDSDSDEIMCKYMIQDEARFPCGYFYGGAADFRPDRQGSVWEDSYTDGVFTSRTLGHISISSSCFYNNLYPMYTGICKMSNSSSDNVLNNSQIDFHCFVFDSNDNYIYDSISYGTVQSILIAHSDMYSFLYNDSPINITIRFSNVNYTGTLLYSQIENTGSADISITDGNVTYKAHIFICNFYSAYMGGRNGSAGCYAYSTFFSKISLDTTPGGLSKVVIRKGLASNQNNSGLSLSRLTPYTGETFYNGCYRGTFPRSLLSSSNYYEEPEDTNIFISVREYKLFAKIFGSEIKKAFSLNYRVDISGTAYGVTGYVNEVTYATHVTAEEEFLAELFTGNLSNDTFRNQLRYWQYSSTNQNEFTEEDIPEPEPEPAPEGEESGDLIDNQYRYFGASKFITQYALTRSQLELFGEKLWTSWADTLGDPTEMWKNFKMFIGGGDTGSIDISTAMDFIVSLRVFPYDLTDSLMQDVNGIRLGRGEYPIDVGVVKKMISLIQYVDFGTITVPRPFGDYRDYENMNVSLVLPYCGTTMLNPGDVIGRNLTCTYAVDLQAGTCEAFVYVTNNGDTGQCRYNVAQMSGQIGALLPVSATNSGQIMSQRISDAASVAATIAAPLNEMPLADVLAGGNSDPDLSNATNISPLLLFADPNTYKSISSVANALSRPAISCPSLGGGAGLSAFHQPAAPYIQLRYGMYAKPNNYNHAVGVPSTSNGVLSSYSGFVVCSNVDVSSLTCHTDEKAAIKAALESGVYV